MTRSYSAPYLLSTFKTSSRINPEMLGHAGMLRPKAVVRLSGLISQVKPVILRRNCVTVSYKNALHSKSNITPQSTATARAFSQTMSNRDVSNQTDINKMKYAEDGKFNRAASSFRNFIEKDGQFAPEKDRYHLYVSYACRELLRCVLGILELTVCGSLGD